MNWFNVDRAGLAAILERRGKAFAVFELIQNSWDSGTDHVAVLLNPVPGCPYAELSVEDWGEGIADLEDAFTMFKPSRRAAEPTKRGRFSLGEKLVLAICKQATIVTRCGTILFDETGRRIQARQTTEGTRFTATIRMTRDEYDSVCGAIQTLIPPVPTTFNGRLLEQPTPIAKFDAKLPTEFADEDGHLHRTTRQTQVEVYEGIAGCGFLCELGIPVVELDHDYSVNVLQKVPLNMDRDNVMPSYLRTINALLLNQVHHKLDAETAARPWAQEAAGSALATPETVKGVIEKRFGDRAVVATPNDPLANAQAEAAGFTVIPGGALPADLWANVRKHQILVPASQAFPTPKPETLAAQNEARESSGVCPLCGK